MICLLKQQSSGVKKAWMLENCSRLDRQWDVCVDRLGEYIGEIHFDAYNYNQINVRERITIGTRSQDLKYK
jgi:hypothetical protein